MARRCFVCGFKSRDVVCPRCNTILRAERAVCRRCGKAFDGWIAACESCGGSTIGKPEGPTEREAVKAMASVPGITNQRAKALVGKGFRDFADVVRLALPENAVRLGLHHAIARKALLLDLVAQPERLVSGARCPMCGAAWLVNATRCEACGSSADIELDPMIVEQKLEEITGEIVDLAEDEDFQGLPDDLRTEFLRAFGGVSPEDLLQEECRHQVEAWRLKGFDVGSVERILTDDLPHFRERSARLIRAQVMKTAQSGKYRCPLCEVRLESTAEECNNCGARFS
jgi:predicted amidophosphoribosyltransferase